MKNLYLVLGVPPGASGDEIKAEYRRRARAQHPDRGGDKAAFQELASAYEVLSDPDRRRDYETERAAWLQEVQAVQCPGCGEANSLRRIRPDKVALCGACGSELPRPTRPRWTQRAGDMVVDLGEQVTEQTGELARKFGQEVTDRTEELFIDGVGRVFGSLRQRLGLVPGKVR